MKSMEDNSLKCLIGGCPEIKKISDNKFEMFDTKTPGIRFSVTKDDLCIFKEKINNLLRE